MSSPPSPSPSWSASDPDASPFTALLGLSKPPPPPHVGQAPPLVLAPHVCGARTNLVPEQRGEERRPTQTAQARCCPFGELSTDRFPRLVRLTILLVGWPDGRRSLHRRPDRAGLYRQRDRASPSDRGAAAGSAAARTRCRPTRSWSRRNGTDALIEATLPQLRAEAVVSHTSAAVLHELPVWTSDLGTVHLTRPRTGGGGKRRNLVTMHTQPLETAEVVVVDGVTVTSLERTTFDLARTSAIRTSRSGRRSRVGHAGCLSTCSPRCWIGADAGTGSIKRAGRPHSSTGGPAVPGSQSVASAVLRARDSRRRSRSCRCASRTAGRCTETSAGTEFMTIGEFDGQVKYEELLRPGESPVDVVVREKRREDMLRALGWQVVRWIWEDLWKLRGRPPRPAGRLRAWSATGRERLTHAPPHASPCSPDLPAGTTFSFGTTCMWCANQEVVPEGAGGGRVAGREGRRRRGGR